MELIRAGTQSRNLPRGEDVSAQVTVSLAEAAHGAKTIVSLPTGRKLEVSIPAGIEDGKQIRLKGQGQTSPFGGEAGDALVTVKIAKHPYLRVDGRDLRLDLPLTLYEAVLGAKVNVPTLDGKVELNIAAGTNGGRTLRLRGKGVAGKGDELVTLKVVLPSESNAELDTFLKDWTAKHPYDPRKGMRT